MLYRIEGFVNCSKWGKVGKNSYISRFLCGENYTKSHLAELWFGTHRNGMSTVKVDEDTIPLGLFLDSIGEADDLPYLAKILSIESPLSIQLHPPKEVAEKLHRDNPKNYPDNKPKPEMAVAFTEVKLLCGMRELGAIRKHINSISAFNVLGQGFQKALNEGNLRDLTRYIFNLEKSSIEVFATQILASNLTDDWSKIVINLLETHVPIDPGFVYVYLLEYLRIQPGEAIFIAPGVPHAYISGDLFECMQASDNVVRGGLTPKYVDSSTFIELFKDVPYSSKLLPIEIENGVKEYRPKDCPFTVTHIRTSTAISINVPSQSIVVNIRGAGRIKDSSKYEDLIEASSYFLVNESPLLELIPKSDLETFIISPKLE